MDNIVSFDEYLNKDNRDFYKNLCSMIDEYIEIEQEVETNENEYSLKHIKNGSVYEEINFEIEEDEKKLEIEISKGIKLNYEYEILSTSDDQIIFSVDTGEKVINEVALNLETIEFRTTFNNLTYVY